MPIRPTSEATLSQYCAQPSNHTLAQYTNPYTPLPHMRSKYSTIRYPPTASYAHPLRQHALSPYGSIGYPPTAA
eukprot:3575531-Rhodomonas_salina.2